ncbi:DUF1194 domain-containing protein [Albidovulum sp.]
MGEHGEYRPLVAPALGLACLLSAAAAAAPARAACRLALLLGIDISASVDPREDELQRKGLAAALLSPAVVDAFLADPEAPVWLSIFEWSGAFNQTTLLDWLEIAGPEDVYLAAGAVARSRRSRDDLPTAIGYAIGNAAARFRAGPDCLFRTLDISGDGRNNDGFPPVVAYRVNDFSAILVNGLAIEGSEAGIVDYYRQELVHGPGSFVIVAEGFRDFERAMRLKLLRELQGPVIGALAP